MKFSLKNTALPLLTLGFGGLALVLRYWLTLSAENGLYPTGHPAGILSYILTAAFLVLLFFAVRPLPSQVHYRTAFRPSLLRMAGCLLGAAGFLYSAIPMIGGGVWGVIAFLLGLGAAASLALVALCRRTGAVPNGWLHILPVIYLIAYTITQVPGWSATPQTVTLFFPLLSCAFLMPAAFYHAVITVRKNCRRRFLFATQAAAFFCLGALCEGNLVFCLCMAGWMASDVCSHPKKEQEEAK